MKITKQHTVTIKLTQAEAITLKNLLLDLDLEAVKLRAKENHEVVEDFAYHLYSQLDLTT